MTRLLAALALSTSLTVAGLAPGPVAPAIAKRVPRVIAPKLAPSAAQVGQNIVPDAPPTPRPGRVQIFGDWALGCDNQLACTAISLLPENASDPYPVLAIIEMAAGPAAAPTLRFSAFDQMGGKLELRVDGAVVTNMVAVRDSAEMTGPMAMRAIRALAAGYSLELHQKKTVLGRISLNGMRESLAALDGQQGRSGTPSALATTGSGSMRQVRPAPPLPSVAIVLPSANGAEPPTLTPREIDDARKLAVCDGRLDTSYPVEVHSLAVTQALVLLPCNAAAYNVSVVPLIAQGVAGSRTLSIARFDHVPGFTGDPGTPPLLVNPRWNPRLGRLASFAKGRGLGDCGTTEDYMWDGVMFRLTEARSMPICRGAWEWPRIWFSETKRG